MSLTVTCDYCAAEYLLRDEIAGKKVRCKSCRNVFEVPIPEEESLDSVEDWEELDDGLDEDSQPAHRPAKSRGRKSKKRSRRGSANQVAEFLIRQWVEAPVNTVVLGCYLALMVMGIVVRGSWLLLFQSLLGLAIMLVVFSLITVSAIQIWYNPWVLLSIVSPIYWVRHLSAEETRVPWGLFKWACFSVLLAIPPFCLAVFFEGDLIMQQRIR